jgi:hypothetical protein
MQIPTDPLGSDDPRPIPPLSQSRQGDMACQALYGRKHVQCASMGESEPAARGIEIHQILATYINHLVRAKRTADLELFDASINGAGTEVREVLEKFRDNHSFDPVKILATELHIALEENFIPIEHPGNDGQISSGIKAEKRSELTQNLAGIVDVRVETELRIGRRAKIEPIC